MQQSPRNSQQSPSNAPTVGTILQVSVDAAVSAAASTRSWTDRLSSFTLGVFKGGVVKVDCATDGATLMWQNPLPSGSKKTDDNLIGGINSLASALADGSGIISGIIKEVQASVSDRDNGDVASTRATSAGNLEQGAVAESGDDLRSLAVCGDLHVSNSLEILSNSDWETDLASPRAQYDAHIQDQLRIISSIQELKATTGARDETSSSRVSSASGSNTSAATTQASSNVLPLAGLRQYLSASVFVRLCQNSST